MDELDQFLNQSYTSNHQSEFIIIIVIILIVIFFIYFIFPRKEDFGNLKSNKYKKNREVKVHSFYKCKNRSNGKILNNIFNQSNINKTDKKTHADLYIPCGYTNVESELKSLNRDLNFNKNNKTKFIFGIDGCDHIIRKNGLWKILENTYGRTGAAQIMPESFVLNNPDDLRLLIQQFITPSVNDMNMDMNMNMNNSQLLQSRADSILSKSLNSSNSLWILKKNLQRKKGLKMTNNLTELLNAKAEGYKVAQRFMTDLFLINKRKINLRIYLLIVCNKGNTDFFLSSKGKCIYTNKDWNPKRWNDPEVVWTSVNLNLNIYKYNPRTLNDLKSWLYSNGYDANLLFNRIHSMMQQVVTAIEPYLCRLKNIHHNNRTLFQLFGADVVFNNNLKPYLLEINKGPDMHPKDKEDEQLKKEVYQDLFNLVGIKNINSDINSNINDDINGFIE